MNKRLVYLALFILITSCNDDPIGEINNKSDIVKTDFALLAGQIFHDSITYYDFNPRLIVQGDRFETDTSYYYKDSLYLDLNSNDTDDLYFYFKEEYYEPDCDCEGIDCCKPWGEMKSTIRTISNIEIATHQAAGMTIPMRFDLGDTIENHQEWENSAYSRIISAWGLTTAWNNTQFNSFIGVRFINTSDTIYGWLRMNTSNSTMIELIDYAIENANH